MPVVKSDQKQRIRLPKEVSRKLRLNGRDSFEISVKDGKIELTKLNEVSTETDLILRDMVERPMHTKIKVTSELLEKWEDEMWMP